jgi:large subunit ribosomal protein L24
MMKFSSPLSENLRSKYKKRNSRPRVGDSVRIVRGEFKDVEGKVTKVLASRGKINVEGVNKEKMAGGTAPLPIDSSKVLITQLNMEDKTRKRKLEGE